MKIVNNKIETRGNSHSTLDNRNSKADKSVLPQKQSTVLLRKQQENIPDDFPEWNVAPSTSPVDGAKIFDEIHKLVKKYVIADEDSIVAIIGWIFLTWLVDYASILPIAMITAPSKECGKSSLLRFINKLSYRTLYASQITASALFRSYDTWKPTILIDEADTFLKTNVEMRGIINAGHEKESALVYKSESTKSGYQPRKYSVWGAKAIAGINIDKSHSTIISRSIIIKLKKALPHEKVDKLRNAPNFIFDKLKSKLKRWSDDNGPKFALLRPSIAGLNNRDADNWEPLLAIAQLLGDEYFHRMTIAALNLTAKNSYIVDPGKEMLKSIQNIFKTLSLDKISTSDLISNLCKDKKAPWAKYDNGNPITARNIAAILKQYSITPTTIRLTSNKTVKGYKLASFVKLWDSEGSNTSEHVSENNVTNVLPKNPLGCDAVTDYQAPLDVDDANMVGKKEISDSKTNVSTMAAQVEICDKQEVDNESYKQLPEELPEEFFHEPDDDYDYLAGIDEQEDYDNYE